MGSVLKVKRGSVIGDYEIVEPVGEGELGSVFKAKDLKNNRTVALKISNPGNEFKKRLSREFNILIHLNHPGIVKVYDFGYLDEDRSYMAMEFVEGAPITRVLHGFSQNLLRVMLDILDVLDYIHSKGMIHSDIKPENILVIEKGKDSHEIKLLDFGFADELELSGTAGGTLGYIAPELFTGQKPDPRSDLYSLGVVLYEILTGQKPFTAKTMGELLKKQFYRDIRPPRDLNSQVPKEFEDIVLKLLHGSPTLRPNSAFEVVRMVVDKFDVEPPTRFKEARKGFILSSPFVGRESLMDSVKDLMRLAKAGKGQSFFVEGEQGIGKTRFLEEIKFISQLEGHKVLFIPLKSYEGKASPLVESFLDFVGDVERPTSSDDSAKFRFFESIIRKLREKENAQRKIIVLIIDDLNLSSSDDLAFLRYLVHSIGEDPIFIAGAYSSSTQNGFSDWLNELEKKPFVTKVVLPPLSLKETSQVVKAVLGRGTNLSRLAEWLRERSGGNPYLITELLYDLYEHDVLVFGESGWEFDEEALEEIDIPQGIHDLLKQKISKLENLELEIMKVSALLKEPLDIDVLEGLFGEKPEIFTSLEKLRTSGYLRVAPDKKGSYLPENQILADIIIERIPEKERRKLHKKIARYLENRLNVTGDESLLFSLAYHYTESGEKDKSYYYLIRAGRRAKELHSLPKALDFFITALNLADELEREEDKKELLLEVAWLEERNGYFEGALKHYKDALLYYKDEPEKKAEVLRHIGKLRLKREEIWEAFDSFEEAHKILSDLNSPAQIDVLNEIGWAYIVQGDYKKARSYFNFAARLSQEKGGYGLEKIYYSLSVSYYYERKFKEALSYAEKGLKLAKEKGDPVLEERFHHHLGIIKRDTGNLREAEEHIKISLELQKKNYDLYSLISELFTLGTLYRGFGNLSKAEEIMREALSYASKVGSAADEAQIFNDLANILYEKGELRKAKDLYKKSLEIYEKKNSEDLSVGVLYANLGTLLRELGDFNGSISCYKKGLSIYEKHADPRWLAQLYYNLFQVYLDVDQPDLAKEFLEKAFALRREIEDSKTRFYIYLGFAELFARLGDAERALKNAEKALELLKDDGGGKELALGQRALAKVLMINGDYEEGKKQYESSIELLEKLNAQFELARTKMELASMEIDHLEKKEGERETLRNIFNLLEESQEIFNSIGSKAFAERVSRLKERLLKIALVKVGSGAPPDKYLKALYRVSEVINSLLDKENFFDILLDVVIEITGAERGVLFLSDEGKFVMAAGRQMDKDTLKDARRISRTVISEATLTEKPVFSQDALQDPRFAGSKSVLLNKIRSLLCVPLISNGKVIGTIYLDSRVSSDIFSEEEKDFLMAVAYILGATIDKTLAFRRIEEENIYLREALLDETPSPIVIGKSPRMLEIYRSIEKRAEKLRAAIIKGEAGAGKTALARFIHMKAGKEGHFRKLETATLPQHLLESELFGHRENAFPGAVADKTGLVEEANEGTLYIDEITNVPLEIQEKIVSLIETETFFWVGEATPRKAKVTFIFGTSKEGKIVEESISPKLRRFLDMEIEIPPLRERAEDIPVLAEHFLKGYARDFGKELKGFTTRAMDSLIKYTWPGNIRELQNIVERAVLLAKGVMVDIDDLDPRVTLNTTLPASLKEEKAALEKRRIQNALLAAKGNIKRAAEILSIHREQLYRLIKKHGIDPLEYRKKKEE